MKKLIVFLTVVAGLAAGGAALADSGDRPPGGFNCAVRGVHTDHGWVCQDDLPATTESGGWTAYAPMP
jgi:hypothetical protein